MSVLTRRDFVTSAAATGWALAWRPSRARLADARIDVLVNEPIGAIAPEIYGHFVEHPGVVRWPGGCFADSYDWHDGIGPRERRPRRTNFWIDDAHLQALGNVAAK